jgi:hypothetical protein
MLIVGDSAGIFSTSCAGQLPPDGAAGGAAGAAAAAGALLDLATAGHTEKHGRCADVNVPEANATATN